MFVDHHGAHLVQSWSLVDLQSTYMTTIWSNQVWLRLVGIIQNPWRLRRSANNEKCSKLDIIPPQRFPHFYSISIYFSCAGNRFWCFFKIIFPLACGAPTSVAMLATTGIPLATRDGAVIATAQGINAPASRQGRSEALARADRRRPAVRHAAASAEPSHHIRHEPHQSSLLDTTQVPRCSSAMPSCEAL
jgi:hypothetical protein